MHTHANAYMYLCIHMYIVNYLQKNTLLNIADSNSKQNDKIDRCQKCTAYCIQSIHVATVHYICA